MRNVSNTSSPSEIYFSATVQQATRKDMKNIQKIIWIPEARRTELPELELDQVKDSTAGKCFMINIGLRVILFSTSNLKMQGKGWEKNYNRKCQPLLEQTRENAYCIGLLTIRIYSVMWKFRD